MPQDETTGTDGAVTTVVVPPVVTTPPAPAASGGAPAATTASREERRERRPIPTMRIPTAEFGKRLKRETAVAVERALGMSLEDAKKKLREGGGAPAATVPAAGQPAATVPAGGGRSAGNKDRELEQAKKRVAELEARNKASREKVKKIKQRTRDQINHERMRSIAIGVGVHPRYVGFAFEQFAAEVAKTPLDKTPPDPSEFFAGLKKTDPMIFNGATAPVAAVLPELPAASAPPASVNPGGVTPVIPINTKLPDAVDVDKMSEREFAAYRRSTYGNVG